MDVSVSHFNSLLSLKPVLCGFLLRECLIIFKAIHIYMVLLYLLKLWFTTNNLALNTVFIIRFKSVSPLRVQVQKGLCCASLIKLFPKLDVSLLKKIIDPCLV